MPVRERIERAAGAAEAARLDALIVAPGADLRYLLDHDPPPLERLTCLVIRPQAEPVLLVPELERRLAEDAGVGGVAALVGWRDGTDPYALVRRMLGRARRVACSDRMWASHLLRLQQALGQARFASASIVLGPLRAVKEPGEVDQLARAARYADEAYARIIRTRLESSSERDVAARLGDLLGELGHDEVTFTIVGSGPNGASPHHEPGDRVLQAGDAVVMDFGGRAGGYCSDITRTVGVREIADEIREVHEIVREAQERAFHAVRPGVPAQEVDRAAREVIASAGYGERFIHRTGHGIGLEEHEPPYLVEGNEDPLLAGMCFSIEPGIYLPGRFGVRIEDIVTVTDDGARRLNRANRELELVG